MRKTISILVSGRVQGVGYRYYARRKALECNVNGFVQNQSNGSVYIEASGEKIDIDTFADWCRKGPTWSRVTNSKISDLPIFEWSGFEIR